MPPATTRTTTSGTIEPGPGTPLVVKSGLDLAGALEAPSAVFVGLLSSASLSRPLSARVPLWVRGSCR
jgi:hypothetical protein